MDWFLDPPEPSSFELEVERRTEEQVGELSELISEHLPTWFNDYIDWDQVYAFVNKAVTENLESDIAEAEIIAWENAQAARDAQ